MQKISVYRFLMASVFSVAQIVWASDSETKAASETKTAEVPYKLVEGKQYEICNALLPFINSVPHGALRDQPELLGKVQDFKLPEWRQVDDKKYIDFFINYFEPIFPQEFSKEKYKENYERISEDISSGKLQYLTSRVDIDNTGIHRNLLRVQPIKNGKKNGSSDTFSYTATDGSSLGVDKQYPARLTGDLIYFKGRTFTISEGWIAGDFKAWKLLVAEPRYVENWSFEFPPHSTLVCTFVTK